MRKFGRRRQWSWLALLGLALGAAALGAAVVAGVGYRIGWLGLAAAFTWLRAAAWIGLAAVVMSLSGVIRARPGSNRRGLAAALLGLVVGASVFWVPFSLRRAAEQVPPIHDVTTDTDDPPRFEAVLPLREGAPNPAEYTGAEVARLQRQAYPEIRPVRLRLPPDRVFPAAQEVARDLGWEIVEASPQSGRIEATDTTFWFGFKDDVVVRIAAGDSGSVIDVRSKSRVGRSDLGKNAERIRRFLDKLREELAGSG